MHPRADDKPTLALDHGTNHRSRAKPPRNKSWTDQAPEVRRCARSRATWQRLAKAQASRIERVAATARPGATPCPRQALDSVYYEKGVVALPEKSTGPEKELDPAYRLGRVRDDSDINLEDHRPRDLLRSKG